MPYVATTRQRNAIRKARAARIIVNAMRMHRTKRLHAIVNRADEIKYTYQLFPMTATYGFTNAFATHYPSAWSTVDLSPGQGVGDNQRVGNRYEIKDINIDLKFECSDYNVQGRFIMFQWNDAVSPDTIASSTFPNPITGTDGGGFNPFFVPKSSSLYKILYTKFIDFSKLFRPFALSTDTVGTPVVGSVKKRLTKGFRRKVWTANENLGPTNYQSTTINDPTTYRGRIYWCMITNNYTGGDMAIAGSVQMRFNDF